MGTWNSSGKRFIYFQLGVLEEIHSCGIVHTNLSPRKILISGKVKNVKIFLCGFHQSMKLNFGAKGEQKFTNENWKPSSFKNSDFTSVNILMGGIPSRKDDLESLGYILMYLFEGGKLFYKAKKENKALTLKELKIAGLFSLEVDLIPCNFFLKKSSATDLF